ncbi:aminotransferase DegT [Candidatus Epulonipiscium fishelsonii]|uniref:Aminotransferase DegT n=1 Tax=Candidatus Epulonipiscium fishelsonii TaxID=77094 RepID=A0ACC8XI83_9FIRM|nr:aminotransferase DegT [Epulopiscium sp. SCG-D08WGA-EpuloA1]
MEFRDLKAQYKALKNNIDKAIFEVLNEGSYITGRQVYELEKILADYVGVKYCITCANGTDALTLVLMVWGVKEGDAVFVPDFTFFATGEVVSFEGATPIFVDIDKDTFNMDPDKLEESIQLVINEGKLNPKAIITVDLFGLPADYNKIEPIAKKYNLLLLEDGAQGFGGRIGDRKACSFGDIATTSFFPAKPLGCYGDGGAIFTNNDDWAEIMKSLRIHGKGKDKYDNVRIGMNSRLDTIQAAILIEKFKAFVEYELDEVNRIADIYTKELNGIVTTPIVPDGFYSSWAQYSIQCKDEVERNNLMEYLKQQGIPTMIYYNKPMSKQKAFSSEEYKSKFTIAEQVSKTILSLPISPYLSASDLETIMNRIGV